MHSKICVRIIYMCKYMDFYQSPTRVQPKSNPSQKIQSVEKKSYRKNFFLKKLFFQKKFPKKFPKKIFFSFFLLFFIILVRQTSKVQGPSRGPRSKQRSKVQGPSRGPRSKVQGPRSKQRSKVQVGSPVYTSAAVKHTDTRTHKKTHNAPLKQMRLRAHTLHAYTHTHRFTQHNHEIF